MQKINKILLNCLFLLAGLQSSFATHIVGGTLEYVRLGPGALPNSSRYKVVLRLWRDGVGANPGATLPSSVVIECRGDTLGYTNAGFDALTSIVGTGLYPFKGLDRMRQNGIAITEANIVNLIKPQFVRDFNITNASFLDTLTVRTGYLTNTNATLNFGGGGSSTNSVLAATTGVPSYENPLYVRSGYPAAQFNKSGGGFIRGMVTVAGVGYGDYKNASGVVDYSKICGEGRLCVGRFVDSCTSAPAVYIQYADYIRVVDLPNIPGGYHLSFNVCCRNGAVKNVLDAGYYVYARIPDIATLDNTVSYIASSVPGFWTGNAQNITVAGVRTPHINNLGSSVSNVTVLGLASSFSGNVYTPNSPNTLISTSKLLGASNFTVVGVPATFKELYNTLGLSILTGLGINTTVSGYTNTTATSQIVAMTRNSSPKYKTTPPLFVCSYNAVAEQILGHSQNPSYDHGVFDMDGDSIAYSFTTPYDGADGNIAEYMPFIGIWKTATNTVNGTVFNNGDQLKATVPFGPFPDNANIASFNLLPFKSGFTYDKPLGMNPSLGQPGLVLNPNTGDLKIQPAGNLSGLYVVSIKAQEFRKMPDGSTRFLGEITRDYQFNVLSCPLPAQALSTTTGLNGTAGCNATNISLSNNSTDAATTFYWDSGKDRYVKTITSVITSTVGGVAKTTSITGLKRIWASNGSTNNDDAQQVSSSIFKQTRLADPVTGVLSAALNAPFTYSLPGTYFFKVVVQDRGSKCADSVYQAVVVSAVKAGWAQLNVGPVCVNSPVTYSPFDITSVNGITSISGSSVYTDINTNPIPMMPFVTVSGTQTFTGFKNYKWMKQHGSLATDTIPPSHAIPQPAKLVSIQWDFGDGVTQVLTLVGTTWTPVGGNFKPNVSVTGVLGPLSIPGIIKSYANPGTFAVTQTVFNQFGCSNSLTRNITVVRAQPTASIIGSNICQNNPLTTISGLITIATGGVWSTSASGIFLQSVTMPGQATSTTSATGQTMVSIFYKPSAAELTTVGFVLPISLTTYGNGVCNAGTSTATPGVTVLSSPIVYAGGTVTICRNNLSNYQFVGTITGGSSSGIWKTMGTGTFASTNSTTSSSLTDTYRFSKADSTKGSVKLALTSTNNGLCFAVTDTLTIKVGTVASVPTAVAGTPIVVCANNSNANLSGTITNSSSGLWTTKGSGTFGAGSSPSSTTLTGANAFYTPSAADTLAGSVKLILQTTLPTVNGGCKNVSDSLTLTIVSSPQLALSFRSSNPNNNSIACSNNAVFTITGTITGATGGIWSIGNGTTSPSNSPSVVSIGTNKFTSTVVYLPSSSEIALANSSTSFVRPSVQFTSTGNGTCNAVSLISRVEIQSKPLVTILGGLSSLSVCKNNSRLQLTGSYYPPSIGGNSYNAQYISNGSGTFTGISNLSGNQKLATYTSSTSDTTNGSVQIIMMGTNVNLNCLPTFDTLNVSYTNLPTISAGSNQTICENNLQVQLNGSVTTPASGGVWTTSGTGSFASTGTTKSTLLNDVYIPTISDFASSSLVLTLATTGTSIGTNLGQCLSTSKSVVIGVSAKPTITFGTVPLVNENNPNIVVSATPAGVNILPSTFATWGNGLGTYTPNKTTFSYVASAPAPFNSPALTSSITYVPESTELAAKQVKLTVSVSGANNCNPISNSITIPITPKPTATIFNKGITVCANNPTIKLTSTVTGASGGIWYSKVNSNPVNFTAPGFSATYVPLTSEINAGSVTLYFSTSGEFNNAKSELDSITIPITPAPIVNTGGNLVMCGTNLSTSITGTVTNALGGIWSTSGSGSFSNLNSISGSVMNNFYSPSTLDKASASPIKLTLTSIDNKGCVSVSDIMNLSFSTTPVANAGLSQVVCVNDFPVSLNASGSNGSWSSTRVGGKFGSTNNATSSSLVDTYTPTSIPGTIILTWTTLANGSCPAVSSNTIITVLSAPIVNIGGNVTVCGTNNKIVLSATVTGATSGNWQASGGGNFSSSSSQIGSGLNDTYNLTASDIASGQITITFSGTGTSPCTPTKATKTITIIPALTGFAGPDQNLCANINSLSATGVLFSNGVVTTLLGGIWTKVSTVTGTFSGASNSFTSEFVPSLTDKNSSPQKVSLVFTPNSLSGCAFASDTVVYTFITTPTVSIFGSDFTVCSDASAIALSGTFTGAAGMIYSTSGTNLNSSWSLSNTNVSTNYQPTAADISAGKLSFRAATNGAGLCGTIFSNVINVTIAGKPIVTAGPTLNICSNLSSFSLTGANITSTGISNPSVVWFSSASTATGGSFDNVTTIGINNLGSNPVYTPSATDIAGGTITLFVNVTGPGTCKSQLLQRLVTFTPAPTVNIGSPIQTYCANTPTITLTGSTTVSNNGFWSITTLGVTGTLNTLTGFPTNKLAIFRPSVADMNLTSVGFLFTTTQSGCNPVSTPKTILLSPVPVVKIVQGNSVTVCGDVLSVGLQGISSVSGAGNWSVVNSSGGFSPNSATLTVNFAPLVSEIKTAYTNKTSIKVYFTSNNNGVCSASKDSTLIFFTTPPTISAGADESFCASTSLISLTGVQISSNIIGVKWTTSANSTISGGMGTFLGTSLNTSTLLSESYLPASIEKLAGSSRLTLVSTGNNAGCQAVSAQKTITFEQAPTLNDLPDQTICANNVIKGVKITANATNFSSILWTTPNGKGNFDFNNITSPTYYPANEDITASNTVVTITCQVMGLSLCSPVVKQFRINISPAPTLGYTVPGIVCADAGLVQLNSMTTSGFGVSWKNVSGVNTFSGGGFFPNGFDLNPKYQVSSNDISNGFVIFNISTTGNGGCNAIVTTVQMSITPLPTITTSSNINICDTKRFLNLTFAGSGFTTGLWTSNGDKTSNGNPTLPTPTATIGSSTQYNFSSDDIHLRKQITLMVTSQDQGLCQPVSAKFTVSFTGSPVLSAGIGANYCEDIGVISLSGSIIGSETYNYRWNIVQGQAGTLTSTNLSAIVGKGVTTTTSIFNTYKLGERSLWINDPGFDFNVQVFATGVCAKFDSNGNNDFYSSDTAIYTIVTKPVITITPSAATFCQDASNIAMSASLSNLTNITGITTGVIWSGNQIGGAGNKVSDSQFSASVFDNDVKFFPATADRTVSGINFIVSTTGNNICGTQVATYVVSVTSTPVVTVSGTAYVCSNQPLVTLVGISSTQQGVWTSGTFAANAGTFVSVNTTGGITTAVYSVSQTEIDNGSATFNFATTNNGSCSATKKSFASVINLAPVVDAGGTLQVCAALPINLSGTVNVQPLLTAPGSIVWTLSTGTGTVANTNITTVSISGTVIENATSIFSSTGGTSAKLFLNASLLGCNLVKDSLQLTYQSVSTLIGGNASQGFCSSDLFQFKVNPNSSQGIWSTTGSGFFLSTGNQSTAKMNDIYKPSSSDVGKEVYFVLSSIPGVAACGSPSPFSFPITFTGGIASDAGTSIQIAVCKGYTPTFVGTITGSNTFRWFTSGTGNFSVSGTNTVNGTSIGSNKFAATDIYVPSEQDKASGKVILSMTVFPDASTSCITPLKDTLTVVFTDKPKAISKGYSRLCGNVSLTDGITVTGVVRLSTPNDVSIYTVHDNASRWRLMNTTTLGFTNSKGNKTGFVTTSSGPNTDVFKNAGGYATYSSTSITGFQEIGVNTIYYPTDYDIVRQNNGDTLSLVIESAEVAFSSGVAVQTITGTTYCDPALDTLKIIFDKSPTASILGSSLLNICADKDTINLKGAVTLALGGLWSTNNGSGLFQPDPTASSVVYRLSNSELNTSTLTSININYQSTGNGSCYPAQSNFVLTVNINPKPNIYQGADQTICADNSTVTLIGYSLTTTSAIPAGYQWVTLGGGTINPLSSSGFTTVGVNNLSAVYSVNSTDIAFGNVNFVLSTTGPNTCKNLKQTMKVDINPLPVLTPSPNVTICKDIDNISLFVTAQNISDLNWSVSVVSGLTTSVGLGTFTGNGLTSISTIVGTSLTNIVYNLTASDKLADRLIFNIVSAGTLPNTSSPPCNSVSQSIRVNFTSIPTVSLASLAPICSDAVSFTLNGSITGALGGTWASTGSGLFSPDNFPTATSVSSGYNYILSSADRNLTGIVVTLTATDIGTCTKNYQATAPITINKLPTVNTGGDTTVCADSPLIYFNTSTVSGATSVSWVSLGTGTFTGQVLTTSGTWAYKRSAADSAAGLVVFQLNAIGSNVCKSITGFKTVFFDKTPKITISAGLDQILCSDNQLINLNGFTDGQKWSWSTYKTTTSGVSQQFFATGSASAGRGVFRSVPDSKVPIDSTAINPTYFPSTEDTLGTNRNFANQVLDIRFRAFGNGSCSAQTYSSFMKVTFTPRPVLAMAAIPSMCENDSRAVTLVGYFLNSIAGAGLWQTSGSGQFLPSNAVNYSPTVSGIYFPTTTDKSINRQVSFSLQAQNMGTCANPIATPVQLFTVNSTPGINPGSDRTVCESTSTISLTGLLTGVSKAQWKSSGTGIFSSNLTNAGSNLSVTGNTLRDVYSPSALDALSGRVNILLKSTATTFNCPVDSVRFSLSFDKTPAVTVGLDKTICVNEGVISLTGTVTNVSDASWSVVSPASGSFRPSAAGLSTQYLLSTADQALKKVQFQLTSGSNQCKAVTSSPVTYFINQLPTANAGNPSVCTINGIKLAGKSTNAITAYWQTDGTGVFSPSAFDSNATYFPSENDILSKKIVKLSFVADGAAICSNALSSVSLNVGDNPIPAVNAGRDDLICKAGMYRLSAINPSDANSYLWNISSVTGSGPALVTISSAFSVNVNVNTTSLYILKVTNNSNQCINSDSIKIQVLTLPSLDLTPRVCYNDTLILPYNQSTPITNTNGTYQWYKDGVIVAGQTSPKRIKATTRGDYTLEYTEFSCSTRDTTNVRPIPSLFTRGKVICAGSSTTLTPLVLTIQGINTDNYTYDWALKYNSSFNGFNYSLPVDTVNAKYRVKTISIIETRDSAKYLVAVIDTTFKLNCTTYDTARVKTHPVPKMQLKDAVGCDNDVVSLNAQPSNLQTPKIFSYVPSIVRDTISAFYNWTTNPVGLVLSPTSPRVTVTKTKFGAGDYTATFTIGECTATATSKVSFSAAPKVSNLPTVPYCVEDKTGITLDAGSGTDLSYLWLSSGNISRTEVVYDTTKYYFKVFNKAGCSVLDSISVTSSCTPKVYIPGAFIPDESCSTDNCNNKFLVRGRYFKNFKIRIYNRWGEVIFASESKDFAWDGTYNGTAMPFGIYPYVIEYESIYADQPGTKVQRGNVTLVR